MTDEDRQMLTASKKFKQLMISVAKGFEDAKFGRSKIPEAASPMRLRNLLLIVSSGVREFMAALDERDTNAIWEELEELLKLANSGRMGPLLSVSSTKALIADLAISRLKTQAIAAAVLEYGQNDIGRIEWESKISRARAGCEGKSRGRR